MAFGGFAPLPLRLGPAWTAAQHGRTAADLAGCRRTSPIAIVRYTPSTSGVTLDGYWGANGNGSANAPTLTRNSIGNVTVTFPAYSEGDYGDRHAWRLRGGIPGAQVANHFAVQNLDSPLAITVLTGDLATSNVSDDQVLLRVYGDYGDPPRISDYGGSTDKTDSATEGRTPYAWLFAQSMQGMMGSAYTTNTGYVHSERICRARMWASVWRGSEKLIANSRPDTADDELETWLATLQIKGRSNDTRQALRQRAAARFKAATGPTVGNVSAAVQGLLGDAYVRTWLQTGKGIASPPAQTYWPGVNPGPSAYDMGNGAWFSERSNYVVEVTRPPNMSDADYLRLINVDLYELLDRILPAWMTFNAAEDVTTGFVLDYSKLDYAGVRT